MATDPLDRFLAQAEARPRHPAIVEEGRTVSYGELAAMARDDPQFEGLSAPLEGERVAIG